jgi:hypothetical protein
VAGWPAGLAGCLAAAGTASWTIFTADWIGPDGAQLITPARTMAPAAQAISRL